MQGTTAFTAEEMMRRRLPIVIIGLIAVSVLLLVRLISFQFQYQYAPEVVTYLESLKNSGYNRILRLAAARGTIYDRGMQPLAVNTLEYKIGISPNLIAEPRQTATRLATLLGLDELDTYQRVSNRNLPWVLLAPRVSAEVGHQVTQFGLRGITVEPLPRRNYPQGTLAAQVLGFVGGDLRGYYGVEGYYQEQLAGRERDEIISNIPFDVPRDRDADNGASLVLTIDRDIQFLAESELQRAMAETGATGGTIIIMDPRTGDILAMTSAPSFDPNAYFEVQDPRQMRNPAVSDQFEPGSVMKVLTMAAAIERGTVGPNDTYFDQGRIEIGGRVIENWDRSAYGVVDMTQVLVQSLNVGVATIALEMGPTDFYSMMRRFGIGRPTGIDLQGEAAGTMYIPGDSNWSESNLGTNSFGQGVAVTPLQLLVAVSAIANDGLMMQPHVFHKLIDGQQVQESQPSTLGRVVSQETADIVTQMMVRTVQEGLDGRASVPGYTIAGKTGTAQIPRPGVGYEVNAAIATFVGFLPADNPQVSVLVKLDRPNEYWGSMTAAPVFQRLAERLVILLKIPPDEVRYVLASAGGAVEDISR